LVLPRRYFVVLKTPAVRRMGAALKKLDCHLEN
jgi:hypothetical protein